MSTGEFISLSWRIGVLVVPKYIDKHCSSYVSWIFLPGTFNQIHKRVPVLHFRQSRVHFSLMKNKVCLLFLIIVSTGHEERQLLFFFFGVDISFTFSVNLFMRIKLEKKKLRESSFACWINKGLIILRFKTNSIKFNNFTYFNIFSLLEIKFTPLNLKPFEVCKCVRLCTLPSSALSWKYSRTCGFQIKLYSVSPITFGRIQWLLWANSMHHQITHFEAWSSFETSNLGFWNMFFNYSAFKVVILWIWNFQKDARQSFPSVNMISTLKYKPVAFTRVAVPLKLEEL